MRSRVDLHFHLLPGVDDGPSSIEQSVELARSAVAEGTGTVVATPHVRSDFLTEVWEIPEMVREVSERLTAEQVPLQVVCGAELGQDMVGRLRQTELELIAVGPPEGRWLLLETPFHGIDEDVHEAADELRDRGFGVVLAHPERSSPTLARGGDALRLEVNRGSTLQVNASSLTGDHGSVAEAAAVALLGFGLADVVASDAHSHLRGPALERGLRAAVDRGVPEAAARRSVDSTPARLLGRGLAPRTAAAA